MPAILIEAQELEISAELEQAIHDFCLEASCISGSLIEKYIFARVLGGVINEAMWAVTEGVASAKDIDLAMKLGTNYPHGPIEWAHRIGLDRVQQLLEALNETVSDNRFSSPPFGAISTN